MAAKLPWKVQFSQGLRRGSYTLWIEDSSGYEVLPWTAFDDSSEGVTKQLAKARLIARAVNAYRGKP